MGAQHSSSISYLDILKDSWNILRAQRRLWWFGLILGLGGAQANINFPFPGREKSPSDPESSERILQFITDHLSLVLIGASVILIIILAIAVIRVIAQAGIILELRRVVVNREAAAFWRGMREGHRYFWKLVALGILAATVILFALFIFLTPVVILFALESIILGILCSLLAVGMFIPLVILVTFLAKFAAYYLVTAESDLRGALELAYNLFKKRFLSSILMGIIMAGVSILVGFSLLFGTFVIAAPTVGLTYLLYNLFGTLAAAIPAVIGGLVLLAALLFVSAIAEAYRQTAWFLFFIRIAAEGKAEPVAAAELVLKKIPDPEAC